jgi:hypothetical protein
MGNNKMKVGDMVLKVGDSDFGQTGIILEINTNSIGNKFIKVLSDEGQIKTWYAELVRNLDMSYVQN